MKNALYFLPFLLLNCTSNIPIQKHVFYLHGRIIELQGAQAEHEQFGRYLYQDIIDSLQSENTIVYHEVRDTTTDFYKFTEQTSRQIDSLIKTGVLPHHITVIGASKGAVMTMHISHLNTNPINYILLAANNDYIELENDWTLHGNILGIYDRSDNLAGKNYQYWIDRSVATAKFKQIEINTRLGHGFLYRPIAAWLQPTKNWIKNAGSQ